MKKSIRKYVILSFQIDDQQVPLALQLRFQAELNQMESIQEAERQLHQINQMGFLIPNDFRNLTD